MKQLAAKFLASLPGSSLIFGPPRAAEWDVQTDDARGILSVVTLDRSPVPPAVRPLSVEPEIWEKLESTLIPDIKPVQVAELRNARYFRPSLAVIDESDRLLYDYTQQWDAWAWRGNVVLESARLPGPERIPGRSLLIDTRSHSQNYFHWLIEACPRLEIAAKAGHPLEDFDHILVSSPTGRIHRDAFEAFGVSPEKIFDVAKGTGHFVCDSLTVVSDFREHLHPICAEILQSRFSTTNDGPAGRIYISRGDAPTRRIANDEEISRLLETMGFRTVRLDGMSIAEQSQLFSSAEIIVAPHGAALANLVFAPAAAVLVELHFPFYTKGLYWRTSSVLGQSYAAVRGTPVADAKKDASADMLVDGKSLAKLLSAYI